MLLAFCTTNMSNEGNKIHAKRIILITWSIVFFREQNIGSRLQCKQFWNNPCFYGLIYLKCSRFIIFCLEPNKYASRKNMLITLPINLFSLYFKVCKSTKIWNYKHQCIKLCEHFTLPLVSTPINWNYISFNAWNDTLMNNNYKHILLLEKKGSYQDFSLYATLCSKTFYLDLTQKSTKIIWDTPSWHVLGCKKYIDLLDVYLILHDLVLQM